MNMMRLLTIILTVIFAISCLSCSTHDSHTIKQDLQPIVATIMAETGIPAVSIYVKSDSYANFSLVMGLADLNEETPVQNGQPFRIGSLSKSFTAAAVLKLVDRGQIDLDAPITNYLGLVNGYLPLDDVTVRQAMNMSSGLPAYLDIPYLTGTILPNPEQSYSPEELLQHGFDSSPTLLSIPGTEFSYTNTNYILLGMLIEEVSGLSYHDYLKQEFITPLRLDNTTIALTDEHPDNLVRGYYDYNEDGNYEDWTEMNMSYVWSAGCIISTAEDIATWMDQLAKGYLFSTERQIDLFEGHTIVEGVDYTAGIVVDDAFAIGHNGTVIGYHADAWYNPELDVTVAVLSNTNAPLLDDNRDPTREIVEAVFELIAKDAN